jgi:hypothetical protein
MTNAAPASEPVSAPEIAHEAPAPVEASASESGEQPAKIPSRREALEKAFATVERGDKPAPAEQPKAEQPKGERTRNPDGTFAAADLKAQEATAGQKPADAQDTTAKPLDEPPARFSPDAKAEWAKAPEAVRGEVRRAIAEMENGLNQYRERVESYAPLEQYRQAAEAQGTNLKSVIDNYLGWENTIKADPVSGMMALAQNMGQHPVALAQAILEQAGVAPGDQSGQSQIYQQQMGAQTQELTGLRQQVSQMQQFIEQMQIEQANAQIASIAKDKPGFDALRPVMGQLIQSGMAQNLDEAYAMAARLKPEAIPAPPQPAPAMEQPAPQAQPAPVPAQNRRANLSVTGSPVSGSNPAHRKAPATPREALQRAFAATGIA